MEALRLVGVAAGVAMKPSDLLEDMLRDRGHFWPLEHREMGISITMVQLTVSRKPRLV